jgi:hypothetical protein
MEKTPVKVYRAMLDTRSLMQCDSRWRDRFASAINLPPKFFAQR